MTIYLVRHAHAGARSHWGGPDAERPLSDKGQHQADALAADLADAHIERVLSSRAVRCQQTVEPLAEARSLEVEVHPELFEGARVADATALVRQLASDGVDAVLSSHGDVIPATLLALEGDGVPVDDRHGLPKATYYALVVDADGRITGTTFVDPRP